MLAAHEGMKQALSRMQSMERVFKQSFEDIMPDLVQFVHGDPAKPDERTQAVTSLVLTACQLLGHKVMGRLPSWIAISHSDPTNNALLKLADTLIPANTPPVQGACREGLYRGTAAQAPTFMSNAIQQVHSVAPVWANPDTHRLHYCNLYWAAQTAGFGSGPSRNFAAAWHNTFGLITDPNDELILRVHSPEDRAALLKSLTSGAMVLRSPQGYGRDLSVAPKHICFAGALGLSEWDTQTVDAIIDLGLPLLMFPAQEAAPLEVKDRSLRVIIDGITDELSNPIVEPANLIELPWFNLYGEELRLRLRHLPANYEYSIQKLARQLFPVCLKITSWCGQWGQTNREQIMALSQDLCARSLRGLVLSVVGLAWHGLGIDPSGSLQEFRRVLHYLRGHGPMSLSDLHRRGHIESPALRNKLVECFVAENLATLDGKVIRATTYPEFVDALFSHSRLPHPQIHWKE